jgi:hypothetical protein
VPSVSDRWTEAKIQRWFVAECRRYGLFVAKVTSQSFRGFPDIIVGTDGSPPKFVELKTHKGRLTKVQKRRLHDMMESGMDVRVYYGKAQAEEFFRDIARPA